MQAIQLPPYDLSSTLDTISMPLSLREAIMAIIDSQTDRYQTSTIDILEMTDSDLESPYIRSMASLAIDIDRITDMHCGDRDRHALAAYAVHHAAVRLKSMRDMLVAAIDRWLSFCVDELATMASMGIDDNKTHVRFVISQLISDIEDARLRSFAKHAINRLAIVVHMIGLDFKNKLKTRIVLMNNRMATMPIVSPYSAMYEIQTMKKDYCKLKSEYSSNWSLFKIADKQKVDAFFEYLHLNMDFDYQIDFEIANSPISPHRRCDLTTPSSKLIRFEKLDMDSIDLQSTVDEESIQETSNFEFSCTW